MLRTVSFRVLIDVADALNVNVSDLVSAIESQRGVSILTHPNRTPQQYQ